MYTVYIYICIICQVDEVLNQTYNSGDPFLYHQHRARLLSSSWPTPWPGRKRRSSLSRRYAISTFVPSPAMPKQSTEFAALLVTLVATSPGQWVQLSPSPSCSCPKWLAVHLHHGCQNTWGSQVALVYHQFPGSLSRKKWSTNMNIMNQQFSKIYTMIVDALPKGHQFPMSW